MKRRTFLLFFLFSCTVLLAGSAHTGEYRSGTAGLTTAGMTDYEIESVQYDDSDEDLDIMEEKGHKDSPFLNPRKRFKKIRRLLRETSMKIRATRRTIRRTTMRILRNEYLIANSSLTEKQTRMLVKQNISLFRKLEQVRMKIGKIQYTTAMKIFSIQRKAYIAIQKSVQQNMAEISKNAAKYWIRRRRYVMRKKDMRHLLDKAKLRKIYKPRQ